MFNFLKKKQPQLAETQKPSARPFDYKIPAKDLEAFYACSVQRTAEDFTISTISLDNGGEINIAMDGLDGFDVKNMHNVYAPNLIGQEVIFTHFATKSFIGFNNCAIIAQDWLINKALNIPCEDAIAINYDIVLKNAEDEDKNFITEMRDISEDRTQYNIKAICQRFAINKRKYGQALCFPLIDNIDYSVPFNLDAVERGAYRGMCIVEPYWVAPILDIEATTDPKSKRFYKPTWFRMPNGDLIHYTWFIFNTYAEVADILKPTYYFGGIPLTQLLYEQVYTAQKTANEAPMLAMSKRLNYMEGNLNAFLEDECEMENKLNLLSWMRNNWGWLFVKKDQRIGQLDTSLTDFDAVTMLGFQLVAAISGVQAVRLLETSPKGWQSNGSLEDRNYSKLQQSIQRLDFVPILDFHYKLLAKSKYGIDKYYECVFDPIDAPTEKERAEINEIKSRTDMNYINAGVISPDEVRAVIRENINSGYNSLAEELEGEAYNDGSDPFADLLGSDGSSTEQNSFSQDEINLDEWSESEHPRNKDGQFSSAGNSSTKNENFQNDVEKVIENAKNNPNKRVKVEIGEVSSKLSKEARSNGFNIEGYKHDVDVSGVRHTFKQHGTGNEKIDIQTPITEKDIKRIPDIIYNYDKVSFGTKDNKGTDIIKYQKQMPDGEIFYLEEIRTGKKTLTIKTMYKKSR